MIYLENWYPLMHTDTNLKLILPPLILHPKGEKAA